MANMYMGEQALGTVAVVGAAAAIEVTDDGNGNVTITAPGMNISVNETT